MCTRLQCAENHFRTSGKKVGVYGTSCFSDLHALGVRAVLYRYALQSRTPSVFYAACTLFGGGSMDFFGRTDFFGGVFVYLETFFENLRDYFQNTIDTAAIFA